MCRFVDTKHDNMALMGRYTPIWMGEHWQMGISWGRAQVGKINLTGILAWGLERMQVQ